MNALMHENCEAFATGNETIERSIASLREKMDRDHAAFAANQAVLNDRFHELSERVHQNYSTLNDKVNTVHHVLRDKIDAVDQKLGARIDAVEQKLSARVDALDQKLSAKLDALSTAFAELRGFHKTVLWVCGGVVTLVIVSLSIEKALGWI